MATVTKLHTVHIAPEAEIATGRWVDGVAFFPDANRACIVSHGHATWLEASSLDEAIERYRNGVD